jgi:hypothetical protein
MHYYHSSFWEDLFFPRRNDNLKRVVVLSAMTGVASATIANYFSKQENRQNTKRTLEKLSEEINVVKSRINDKAHHLADDFNDGIKRQARRFGESGQQINNQKDDSNSE